jgi:DNA-binding CsgD family transcriptional regulator
VKGAALRCRGLVEGNANVLLAAASAYRSGPRWLDRAAACEDAAVALSAVKRTDEARELFGEAFKLYEQIGASLDLSRAEARARAAGHKRGARGSRARPKFGWDALTPTENRVVDLVVQGLSNREIANAMFLSPHTVHTHVSHALAKVGVSSRVALTAAYSARHV